MKKILNLTLILSLCIYCISSASIFVKAQNKSFSADTIFDDDLYLAGNSVRFESQINGDLIGACQDFVYSGQSLGGINWAARHINIIGPVAGSVRAFAQSVEINSNIGRNLIIFAQSINIGPSTEITRDASLFGSQITFEGKVAGKMKVNCERIKISGVVDGDLIINALELEVSPNAVINGNLTYKSPDEAKIPAGAIVQGKIKWVKLDKEAKAEKYHAFRSITGITMTYALINILLSCMLFLTSLLFGNAFIIPLVYWYLLISGVIVLALTKNRAIKSVAVMRGRPWVSLGLGFVFILLLPIAIIVLLILCMPLSILLLLSCGILLFNGAVYSALYTGSFVCKLTGIKKQEPSFVCLILGIIILISLALIPILGFLVILVVLGFGLGSTLLSFEIFNPKKLVETIAPPDNE